MADGGPPITTLDDVERARTRLGSALHRTPMLACSSLGVRFKAELFQKTGSFKPRGALSRILSLTPQEREAGVVTVSSGNAAAAVAYGAGVAGCEATVCMPSGAVQVKVDAVRGYGGKVEFVDGDLLAGYERVRDERRLVAVHPFDDADVVAGIGSLGLEIVEDAPDARVVVVPVGGGGLLSGVAAAVKLAAPGVRVVGVEPEGADIVSRSVAAGRPLRAPQASVADGLIPPFTCQRTLAHVERFVDDLVTVSDADILRATRLIWQRAKLAAEPSGAAAYAAVLAGRVDAGGAVCIVSGGNVNLDLLAEPEGP